MKFIVTADTAVFVNGKIKTVKAGEIDTTDKDFIRSLEGAKGVTKAQAKSKSKPE